MRNLTALDLLLTGIESTLTGSTSEVVGTPRPHPADNAAESPLSNEERKHTAALMRVNHAGEIAAQALYQGQALTARTTQTRERLLHSAEEEQDHLIWCKQRVEELGESTSQLEPLWHWGSFCIGAFAGVTGDKWSLGFIKETEDQVIEHLQGHLAELPLQEEKSRRIIKQMIIDEDEHGDMAVAAGGQPLPTPVKHLMKLTAKVMTGLSYRI